MEQLNELARRDDRDLTVRAHIQQVTITADDVRGATCRSDGQTGIVIGICLDDRHIGERLVFNDCRDDSEVLDHVCQRVIVQVNVRAEARIRDDAAQFRQCSE